MFYWQSIDILEKNQKLKMKKIIIIIIYAYAHFVCAFSYAFFSSLEYVSKNTSECN